MRHEPDLISRTAEDDAAKPRAVTQSAASSSCCFFGVNSGIELDAEADLFRSVDDEDRGGVVIRLTIPGTSSGDFIPFARQIPNGVELHLAGQQEGEAMLRALRGLLSAAEYRPLVEHGNRHGPSD